MAPMTPARIIGASTMGEAGSRSSFGPSAAGAGILGVDGLGRALNELEPLEVAPPCRE